MTLDLVAINAYGRPLVQPSPSVPASLGVRPADDPREAAIPATPLAARNSPDLRQSVGPRQSSSSADTRDDDERSTVNGRAAASSSGRSRRHGSEEDGDRGNSVDVTV